MAAMADLTARLRRRIEREFPAGTAEEAARCLTGLPADAFGGQDQERVMAAVVLASDGRWERFLAELRLLTEDWRDVLIAGGLAGAGWRARLEAELPTS
jgi:hypothetical protein